MNRRKFILGALGAAAGIALASKVQAEQDAEPESVLDDDDYVPLTSSGWVRSESLDGWEVDDLAAEPTGNHWHGKCLDGATHVHAYTYDSPRHACELFPIGSHVHTYTY